MIKNCSVQMSGETASTSDLSEDEVSLIEILHLSASGLQTDTNRLLLLACAQQPESAPVVGRHHEKPPDSG